MKEFVNEKLITHKNECCGLLTPVAAKWTIHVWANPNERVENVSSHPLIHISKAKSTANFLMCNLFGVARSKDLFIHPNTTS